MSENILRGKTTSQGHFAIRKSAIIGIVHEFESTVRAEGPGRRVVYVELLLTGGQKLTVMPTPELLGFVPAEAVFQEDERHGGNGKS